MKFIFVCPETGQEFFSANFEIADNRGVRTDATGNRIFDARVVLADPCPHCGRRHDYHASELSCPFAGPSDESPRD